FQARGRSPEHREARFRDLGGPLEIEEAERFADFVMGLRREGKLSRLPPLSDLGIVLAAGADWHRWMRQVRKLTYDVPDLLVDLLDVTCQRLDAIAVLAHARLLGRRVLPPALGLPDGLRGAIPQRLEILGLLEETTARGVGAEQFLDEDGRASAASGETLGNGVWLLADEPQVQHGRMLLRFGRGLLGFDARDRADLVVGLQIDDAHAHRVTALRGDVGDVDADQLALGGDD